MKENDIIDDVGKVIDSIELKKSSPLNKGKATLILECLIAQDYDLKVILDLFSRILTSVDSDLERGYYVGKLLNYYGINNNDLVETRFKYQLDGGTLVKKSFFNQKQKKNINKLLDELDYGTI